MKCDMEGVIIKILQTHSDERGWLAELFRADEIPDNNNPVMAYVSLTRPGVARGPHEHREQSDLFCFTGPSTFRLYLWDNRPSSSTFGQKLTVEFGEDNPAMVIVPAGVVHAYKNIGATDGLVFNAPNRLYKGKGRTEPTDEICHEENPNSPFELTD